VYIKKEERVTKQEREREKKDYIEHEYETLCEKKKE